MSGEHSIARRLGRAWGAASLPSKVGFWLFLGIVAVLGFQFARAPSAADVDRDKTAAQRIAAENARRAAFVEGCTTGVATLLEKAGRDIEAKNFEAALSSLTACNGVATSDEFKAQLAKARAGSQAQAQKQAAEDRVVAAKNAKAEAARKRKEGVSIGMSAEDVLASSWGKPERVNTTTTAYGTREQWVYGRNYLYFTDGTLTTIQN